MTSFHKIGHNIISSVKGYGGREETGEKGGSFMAEEECHGDPRRDEPLGFQSSFYKSDFVSPFRPGENIICREPSPALAQSENEAKLLEKIKKAIEPPVFLTYKESLTKLEEIITLLHNAITHPPPMRRPTAENALIILCAACIAQFHTIKKLNNETINCDVPWDQRTGFPVHSTIIADAQKFCELFHPPPCLETLLRSLSRWTTFSHEEFKCCCGRGWKLRILFLEIMVNTFLDVTEKGLMIKQIVGIKSDDRKHLQEHYNQKRGSHIFHDLVIVGEEASVVCVMDNKLSSHFLISWYSDQFDHEEFRKKVRSLSLVLKTLR